MKVPTGRDHPSVPTADTERRQPLTQASQWNCTQLRFAGHDISVDVTTGNLLITTTDAQCPYHALPFGITREYDLQEQFSQWSYSSRHPNVDLKPHWFGNWRFGFEGQVDEVWRHTLPEVHVVSGTGINGLFEASPPDFGRRTFTASEIQALLRKYGVAGRSLLQIGLSSSCEFLLRTIRGPFQILTGRLREESLVDPAEIQLWCFTPVTGTASKVTSDYYFDVMVAGFRDVGRSAVVSQVVDALGHAVSLTPNGSPPYRSFLVSDGSGRSFVLELQASVTSPDPLQVGRFVRKQLVSAVLDRSGGPTNRYDYAYTASGLLWKVSYPSSLGGREVRYHYDSARYPNVLTAIEDCYGKRISFDYEEDRFDNDDRLNPRLKVSSITAPNGSSLAYRYSNDGSQTVAIVSEGGAVDREVRYTFIRDEHNTRKRYVTTREVSVTRGYLVLSSGAVVPRTPASPQLIQERSVFSVDGRFNLLKKVDGLGRQIAFEYNNFNQITRQTDADGHWTVYRYDLPSSPDQFNPLRYDLLQVDRQQLVRTRSSTGRITESVETLTTACVYGKYDANTSNDSADHLVQSTHRITTITDARLKTWGYGYDDVANSNPLQPTSFISPVGRTTRKTYNAQGQTLSVVDAEGNVHAYSYNGNGSLKGYIHPDGEHVSITYYSEAPWVRTCVDQNAKTTQFIRDRDGRIGSIVDPVGDVVDLAYDPNGRVSKLIQHRPPVPSNLLDPASPSLVTPYPDLETTFSYYALGTLRSMKNPKGLEVVFSQDEDGRRYEWRHNIFGAPSTMHVFDAAGQVLHRIDRSGRRTDYAYWNSGRLQSVRYPSWSDEGSTKPGKFVQLIKYDYDGRLLSVIDSEVPGTGEFVYDVNGNLLLQRDADGWECSFWYDDDNILNAMSDSSGAYSTTMTLDSLGRVANLTDSAWLDGSLTWQFGYRRSSGTGTRSLLLCEVALPSLGLLTSFDYDAKHRLTSLKHTRLSATAEIFSQDVTYQDDDLVATIAGADANSFRYDGLKQLVLESTGTLASDYDAAGNRITRRDLSVGPGGAANTYDATNRLLSESAVPCVLTYDAVGNVVTSSYPVSRRLYFDGMGQLRVILSSNQRIEYLYDRLGRLRERTVRIFGPAVAEKSTFRYALSRPVLIERNDSPFITLTWGANGRLLRSRWSAPVASGGFAHSLFGLYDALGSLVRLIDEHGNSIVSASYDPWGKLTLTDSQGLFDFWGYRNGLLDIRAGYVLFGARWYDPSIGRWLSEDPVAVDLVADQFQTGNNLYRYALNSPVSLMDSAGTEADPIQLDLMKEGAEARYEEYRAALRKYGPLLENLVSGGRDFMSGASPEVRDAYRGQLYREFALYANALQAARDQWLSAEKAVSRAQGVDAELRYPNDWRGHLITEGGGTAVGGVLAAAGLFTGITEGVVIGFLAGLLFNVSYEKFTEE